MIRQRQLLLLGKTSVRVSSASASAMNVGSPPLGARSLACRGHANIAFIAALSLLLVPLAHQAPTPANTPFASQPQRVLSAIAASSPGSVEVDGVASPMRDAGDRAAAEASGVWADLSDIHPDLPAVIQQRLSPATCGDWPRHHMLLQSQVLRGSIPPRYTVMKTEKCGLGDQLGASLAVFLHALVTSRCARRQADVQPGHRPPVSTRPTQQSSFAVQMQPTACDVYKCTLGGPLCTCMYVSMRLCVRAWAITCT